MTVSPSVGQYNTVKKFGSDLKGGQMAGKAKWRPLNDNPPPGYYNPNKDAILHHSRSAVDIGK